MEKNPPIDLKAVSSSSAAATPLALDPPPKDDRISQLSNEILHHILGFLEVDEFLIRTSLVSTKWRNLWKSVSNLNFPDCLPPCVDIGGDIRNNAEKYQNFVDHVLRLRDSRASKIQFFKFSISMYDSCRNHDFIVSAVNQGAQEIQINSGTTSGGNIIHFNPSIFTSEELRKFTFHVSDNCFLVQFPSSMCCATQLTHLRLYRIRLPGDLNAQLHLVCPVLETLDMGWCYSQHLKVLDISAPKLITLSICNTYIRRNAVCDFLGGCRIEIRTPNLTSLDYYGDVYVDCFTENLPRIAQVTLDFSMGTTSTAEQKTSFAIKLLKGLTSAKTLCQEYGRVFPEYVVEEIFEPFTSLTTLTLTTSVQGMVHILNNCNSLEFLTWTVDEKCTVEGDDNKHLMLPQCVLSHLKDVYIWSMHGHKNEIEFLKFLLKSSVVLEYIRINTVFMSPNKKSIEENLKQFIEEEPAVRRSIKLYINGLQL